MGTAERAAVVPGELLLGARERPDHHDDREEHQDHGDGDSHGSLSGHTFIACPALPHQMQTVG